MISRSTELLELGWLQLWQISVLIPIVALACRTVLRRHPYLCRGLWLIVLVKCLLPPIIPSVFGIFSWSQLRLHEIEIADAISVADRFEVVFASIAQSGWLPYFGLFWATGAATYLITVIVRMRNFQRLVASATVVTPTSVERAVDRLRREAPDVPLRVHVVDRPLGPAVMGIWNPIVVLPLAVVEGKRESDLRPMIAHEMLHVRRGDTVIAVLQLIVQTVWWFHPLVWLATRDCSLQSELCCDREVLSLLKCSRKAYANCLVGVIEAKCRLQPILGTPGVRAAEVTRHRLTSIVDTPEGELDRPRVVWAIPIWALLMSMLILPGKGLTLSAELLQPVYRIDPQTFETVSCLPDVVEN